MTGNFLKTISEKMKMFDKRISIKIPLFVLLVLGALGTREAQAQRVPISSVMFGEKEMFSSSRRLWKNKLQDFSNSHLRRNDLNPYQIFSQNHKVLHLNSSLLLNNREKKRNLICRKLSTTLNPDSQPEEEVKRVKDNLFSQERKKQALIIGGGQSGLAVAYFLKRHKVEYAILDSEKGPGGAWQYGWNSLRLFSPAQWSSLPGWAMPPSDEGYPSKNRVIHYLTEYEKKYGMPIERPVKVKSIKKVNESFVAYTDKGGWESQVVVSTTGKWSHPFIPDYPGRETYKGNQIHSAYYQNPDPFRGQRVFIVGGGNSGAQILAEVSKVAQTTWVTLEPPNFLPDDVDGRILFERASQKWKALQEGRPVENSNSTLADIVMVPPVKEARAHNVLQAVRPFAQFKEQGVIWQDGTYSQVDSVIWCTGFKPALDHLGELDVVEPDGKVKVNGTRSLKEPRLWLVGYGDWVGYASATLVGVTRTARDTAIQIAEVLGIPRKE